MSGYALRDERIERCDREIERIEAYLRDGHAEEMELALMGLFDWRMEKRLILAEDMIS